MRDIPIIFSAPMVRALLDGRKRMTRRLVKPQPKGNRPDNATWAPDDGFKPDKRVGQTWALHSPYLNGTRLLHSTCKVRYQPGDRLWVRESIWEVFAADGPQAVEPGKNPGRKGAFYRVEYPDFPPCHHYMSRPAIHMPRWASRLTLTVTAVRVERLHAISREDAMAEGIEDLSAPDHMDFGIPGVVNAQHPVRAFWLLWDSLHGPDAWNANPEVVVISFDVRKGNIDA